MKLCECRCGEAAPIATETNKVKGYIKGEPIRFIYHHGNGRCTLNHGFTKFHNGRWSVLHRGSKERTLWSRIVYQNYFLNGEEISSRMFVHHKDGNTDNDSPENLELISIEDHTVLHRGKIVILEKKNEILEFPSASQAGIFLSRTCAALSWAIKEDKKIDGWRIYYTDGKIIPSGMFIVHKNNVVELCSLDPFRDIKHDWSRSRKVTIIEKEGEKHEFASCSKAAKHLNVASMSISDAARKRTKVKGWHVYYK